MQEVLQLKISLADLTPRIWRRVQVRSSATLLHLHDVIQSAFEWDDSHLHEFRKGRNSIFADAGCFMESEDLMEREANTRLCSLLREPKNRLQYLYDFGDSWLHEIVVEKVLTAEAGVYYPNCLAGARKSPPDDCGGAWGYQSMVEALADPTHDEHGSYLEWVGEDFDPEDFDLAEVNKRLRHL